MENYKLKADVPVFCVTASSFPDCVQEAFQTLEKMLPTMNGRTFYGISWLNENNEIVYKAAVNESYTGEAARYACEPFVIRKGDYLTETVMNWCDDTTTIGTTFKKLLADPRMDASYPCVEWYKSDKEMMCMVKEDPAKV
jgi:hypothetical protein